MAGVSVFEAVVYGAVQGLTEFLPVSSTAHLRLTAAFAGWEDPGASFTAVIQLGTLAAVLVFFRADLWAMARAVLASITDRERRRSGDALVGWGVLLGTVPLAVTGLLLRDVVEGPARNLWVIAAGLGGFAVVMEIVDRRARGIRRIDAVGLVDGVWVGLAQVLALVPGVSRSGSTITAGRLRGMDRAAATRFSFLLSVPAVTLAGLFGLRDVMGPGAASPVATVTATIVSFLLGYASIAGLLRLVTRRGMTPFTVYRLAAAGLVVVLLLSGRVRAS